MSIDRLLVEIAMIPFSVGAVRFSNSPPKLCIERARPELCMTCRTVASTEETDVVSSIRETLPYIFIVVARAPRETT